ncbi:bath-38 [Symbiodinium natans]|uniref:Bath-38 protein n=1 Tax=Symbiodinium natans TaxID=878477 RepID=A0A812J0H1_9DINO|nr:bath-38 [Symbiodinium natans]
MSHDAQQTAGDEQVSASAGIDMQHVNDVVLEFDGASKPVCSALLRLASPVFDRMLGSGMQEAQQGSIKVEVATPGDFDLFYSLLLPGEWSPDLVTEKNVDALLGLSDYYQVRFIKKGCEKRLLQSPVTKARLMQAHRHGLKEQCTRCVDSLAALLTEQDLVEIGNASPELLLQVALAVRKQALTMQRRVDELEPALKKAKTCFESVQSLTNNLSACTQGLQERPGYHGIHGPLREYTLDRENGDKLKSIRDGIHAQLSRFKLPC